MIDQPLLSVRQLTKTFRSSTGKLVTAVAGIDFHIARGEIYSLLGPNGAGKTTAISMISGLLTPDAGDATIGGKSITREPIAAKRLLGVVPQEIALYPTLSARQNLEFFGKMYGMGGRDLGKQVDRVLDFIDLTDRQRDKVQTFSGGMKRRVNIAIGLLHQPQLLFMDEPTVGIDPQNRRRILDTVRQLREQGTTVLYTSHLMEEVQELSDRVAIIDHGAIIAEGTVGELIQRIGESDRLILRLDDDVTTLSAEVRAALEAVASVTRIDHETNDAGETHLIIYAQRGRRALPDVIRIANAQQLTIVSVEVREPDLEAVFLNMTGRALRD